MKWTYWMLRVSNSNQFPHNVPRASGNTSWDDTARKVEPHQEPFTNKARLVCTSHETPVPSRSKSNPIYIAAEEMIVMETLQESQQNISKTPQVFREKTGFVRICFIIQIFIQHEKKESSTTSPTSLLFHRKYTLLLPDVS